MSADKHPAEVLAEKMDAEVIRTVKLDVMHNDAAAMLRTIPALEAERDKLRAEVASLRNAPAAPVAPSGYTAQEWHDAKLRGIASDYFPDAKDWPAAMRCMQHLLMEQRKTAHAAPVAQPVSEPLTDAECLAITGTDASHSFSALVVAVIRKTEATLAARWGVKLEGGAA